MKTLLIFCFLTTCSFVFQLMAKEKADKSLELIDFSSMKKILKNDMLDTEIKKKEEKRKKIDSAKVKRKRVRYNLPKESDFWSFFTEYWLVKNATILKWDFQKPDYGIEDAFKYFLEKQGYYETKFKILFLNIPGVFHFALPSDPGEYLFLISIPFVRTLDLSKLEISILLFEDLLRAKSDYFKRKVTTKKLKSFWGKNYYKKKLDLKTLNELVKNYDTLVFDKGFSFQQQFEITNQISSLFKSDLKLWNTYYRMLEKIDDLVKSNLLYQNYNKIYPSPELQINWLKPKNKVL